MNRQEARETINSMDITTLYFFKKSAGYMYCCPICGSGTGANKTGALKIRPGQKIRCYAHECFGAKGEDVVGALRILWACSEDEVFNRVLGDKWQGKDPSLQAKPKQKETDNSSSMTETEAREGWISKTRSFIESAKEDIANHSEALEYLKGRGFTEETIERFSLGYDQGQRAIVIPYTKANTYYSLRKIDKESKLKHLKPDSKYNGISLNIPEPLFNQGALKSGKPVFVVESALCAISIEQAVPSSMAVALGGIGTDKLFQAIGKEKKGLFLILCLDNDEAGKKAQKGLSEKLSEEGIEFIEYNIAGACKDPNEALVANEGSLIENIYDALDRANEGKENKKKEYLKQYSNREYLLRFTEKVRNFKGASYIPTGITSLDKMLDGGLYAGLYIVGAISSLGKTTLCMQIMDGIAAGGRDALIFSLEMDREELISKSISRHTFQICDTCGSDKPYKPEHAKTCRGISDGSRYSNYSKAEKALINEATMEYGKYCGRVFISEGMGDIGTKEIRERIEEHITFTGRKPVVLIDYLQILAPYKDPEAPTRNLTDKQATDKNVLELKRISRDFNIPVIAVSSLNRASYNASTSMASFKESGSIEYSADVLIGLEYSGIKESELDEIIEKNSEKTEAGNATEIKVKILKQRAGARGASCILDYFPMFNAFTEHNKEMNKPQEQRTGFTDVTDDIDVPF